MKQRLKLAHFTGSLIGQPYKLGSMDCATLIVDFARHAGMEIPAEYKGLTMKNYAQLYQKDSSGAIDLLIEWATSTSKQIPIHKIFAGDLLIVRPKTNGDAPLSLLIHAGQDLALGVFEARGVSLVPIRAYTIEKAYRWREKKRPRLMTRRKYEKWKE